MKKIINLLFIGCYLATVVLAQSAEPAITGAYFTPNTINIGETSLLRTSFVNTGSTPIPTGAIELTITTTDSYYTTDGITVPGGVGGGLFNWVYLGTDTWRGTNINAIPAFGGGEITLQVSGTNVSTTTGVTNVNVQPVNSFASFIDAADNNNLQPELSIITPAFSCVDIAASVWLEGAYSNGEMHTTLNELGYLPGQVPSTFFGTAKPAGQPYTAGPWNYGGVEGDTYDANGGIAYPATVTDWVLVSLRTSVDKASEVCTRVGLLHSDGQIELIATTDCCQLDISQSYYVVIEHRNHLIVMSPQAQPVSEGMVTFDFRTQQSYRDLLGFGQKKIGSAYAMYAGNGSQSSTNDILNIIASDKDEWLDENGEHSSYYFYDFDLNGDTNVQDKNLWLENNGIFSDVPR